LGRLFGYLPLNTDVLRQAAEFWAESRSQGFPTAGNETLDGDVILAAQAKSVDGTIITSNRKHLSRFVPAKEWHDVFG